MIQRIKYQDIDFKKYNGVVSISRQKNFYCNKEILDVLSKNWEILIYNDYEAVMPVPYLKKSFAKIVLMPLFCQQLGIFGADSQEINDKFLEYFQKNYIILNYNFNTHNNFSSGINLKKNFVIPVQEYGFLRRKKYFKGRKSTVKTAQYLEFKELFLDKNTLEFLRENFKGLDKKKDEDFFVSYIYFLNQHHKLKIYGSFCNDILTNVTILITEANCLYLLGLINNEKLKDHNGASFLIDRILNQNVEYKSFDFMGGSIRGIEVFFKSFGAEMQQYPVIQNSKKDILKKWLKIS